MLTATLSSNRARYCSTVDQRPGSGGLPSRPELSLMKRSRSSWSRNGECRPGSPRSPSRGRSERAAARLPPWLGADGSPDQVSHLEVLGLRFSQPLVRLPAWKLRQEGVLVAKQQPHEHLGHDAPADLTQADRRVIVTDRMLRLRQDVVPEGSVAIERWQGLGQRLVLLLAVLSGLANTKIAGFDDVDVHVRGDGLTCWQSHTHTAEEIAMDQRAIVRCDRGWQH